MKSPREWSMQFCNKYIINVRNDEFTQFIAEVQRDALANPPEKKSDVDADRDSAPAR